LKNVIDADRRIVSARGLVARLRSAQRLRLLEAFADFRKDATDDSVLDVGMMPIPLFDTRESLSAWVGRGQRSRITSYRIPSPGDPASLQRAQEEFRLPFEDRQFDWIFCAETIEHAGSYTQQYTLVKELARVARKGVFVTTSNRRHPIEFNTALPLIHWLPASMWRRILAWLGKGGWGSESVLNLLDSRALYRIGSELPGKPENDVGHKRVWGLKAHFFLMIRKDSAVR
jgi:hypothetical protein